MHKNILWIPAIPARRHGHDRWVDMIATFTDLPKLEETSQTKPHNFNVLEHTRVVFEAARLIVSRLPDHIAAQISCHDVLYAAALHDVGKPQTAGGDLFHATFHGHEKASALIAAEWLKSEEYPDGPDFGIIKVTTLIELHLRPAFLFREMKTKLEGPTKSAMDRLNRHCQVLGGIGNELAILALADFYGKAGEDSNPSLIREYVHFLYEVMYPTREWTMGGGVESLILQCESNWKGA